jgi:flagellar M-ring protein FliF
MNEWLKKFWEQIKGLWTKWTLVQKIILFSVVAAAIAALVIIIGVSSAPSTVRLIETAITSEDDLDRITSRLDKEGIKFEVKTADKKSYINVPNEKVAKHARSILVSEDLLPKGTSPWDFFKMDRWTLTDFDRKQTLRQAIASQVESHIESLGDVDNANVTITMPDTELFAADQKQVTASIIISPAPGSDITSNKQKLLGIQRLIKLAVEGLSDENIVITDMNGIILNDFAGMAEIERIDQTKKEQKVIREQEAYYRALVLKALQTTYGPDRVRDLNIKIFMDMSKKQVESKEYLPFVRKPDNPKTPYDDSEIFDSVTRSSSKTDYTYQGTGFVPEGPSGTEGQTAPAYKDMQNMNGRAQQTSTVSNQEIGEKKTNEIVSPKIDRVTVSVNIDGKWEKKYDDKGRLVIKPNGRIERIYVPLSAEEIKADEAIVKNAIGFDLTRGDAVTVQNIAIDREGQFHAEDMSALRNKQIQDTVLYSLIGLAGLMVIFILVRLISREVERRKRLKEEELARRHQMMRESALRQAEEEGVEVSMSVEERKRLEMQESAINMAKEHPEDVAQLIRTWLMEE